MIRILIAEDDPQCFQQMEQFIRDYSSETGRAPFLDALADYVGGARL